MTTATANLYEASRQWASRPDDQRFWTLDEMLATTQHYRNSAAVAELPVNSLVVEPIAGDDLVIVGKSNQPAKLTHWSLGQLARTVGAPADYLRSIPAPLAASNLNYGLAQHQGNGNLLIHRNGSLVLRSLTSDCYSRIWDCDLVRRCLDLQQAGWRVPPARPCRADQAGARRATDADVLAHRGGNGGLSINVGDLIAPAGLYASDHDCFIFMVNEARVQDGSEGGLSRGFFLSNSEVGAAALKLTTFLYRHVCGNHIVWDVANVSKLKIVHRGNADRRFFGEIRRELGRYTQASASEDEARIQAAQRFSLGADKEKVLDALFTKLRGDVSRKVLELSYDQADVDSSSDRTIDPRTAWGFAQGMTAYSQTVPYQDERSKIDKAAGKVVSMAF